MEEKSNLFVAFPVFWEKKEIHFGNHDFSNKPAKNIFYLFSLSIMVEVKLILLKLCILFESYPQEETDLMFLSGSQSTCSPFLIHIQKDNQYITDTCTISQFWEEEKKHCWNFTTFKKLVSSIYSCSLLTCPVFT